MNRQTVLKLSLTFLLLLIAADVFAAGGGMPWEGPMARILRSFTGPVAKAIGTMAIIATGLGLAFGEGGGGMKKLLSIVFGLSIAFTAATFGLDFFDFTGGVRF